MRYHYILTIQWQDPRGVASNTAQGVTEARPGETRADIYDRLRIAFMRDRHVSESVTLAFELEPDDLGAAS